MTLRWLWWALACLPMTVAAQSGSAPVHVVRPGETLWDISRQHYGQPLRWPTIQSRNGVAEPRLLQVGTVLHFADGQTQAVVVAASGDVQATDSGDALRAGTQLSKGALVRTGPDSFVTLLLPDGSLCTLPSNSTVRLLHMTTGKASGPAVQLELEAGEVESRVPPRTIPRGQDSFRVRTRTAVVGVRGTRFRVRLTDTDRVAVSVLESLVAVQAAGGQELELTAPEGVVVGGGPLDGVVQPLLAAPEWVDAGLAQNQPGVLLAWNAVPGAQGYRVQLARDAEFIDHVAEQRTTDGERTLALFGGIEPGSYFARVAAVTAEGVQGREAISGFSRGTAAAPHDGRVSLVAGSDEIEFEWDPLPDARYVLEIAEDAGFTRIVLRTHGLRTRVARVQALPPGQYFWRARADVITQGQHSEAVGAAHPLWVEGVR